MQYTILSDSQESLLTRLLNVRNIPEEHMEDFLQPSYAKHRWDRRQLRDINKAVKRIQQAIEKKEKIMIFGDYDVDGIMSSYIMYMFFRSNLWYKNISIRLPHRTKDGYGIKNKHIDEIHELWCTLIITVDNGITSTQEIAYAQSKNIDTIVTDHHKPLDILPEAYALVNPHISPAYPFPEICWATVAFKVCCALAGTFFTERTKIQAVYDHFLPFVSIATIADCMPLIEENRLLVTKWFALINRQRHKLTQSLRQFLDWLNIREIESYHVGFMIGPRLNATGRMGDAMDGLISFLINNKDKQIHHLNKIEEMNNHRRNVQDTMTTEARAMIDTERLLLYAASPWFHEGIVGIVAWRITEQFHKPSLIMHINEQAWTMTGSLRAPAYFNIVDMLKTADDLLLRYWGHAQAWWMSVAVEHIDEVITRFQAYCDEHISAQDLQKSIDIDTILYSEELNFKLLDQIQQLWPFGEANPEPLFLLEEVEIQRTEKIGKWERKHLKLHCRKQDAYFTTMQRGKGDQHNKLPLNKPINIIGKVKKDTYNGGFYIDGKWLV